MDATKPTPPSGTPAAMATTPEAARSDEIRADKGERASAILDELRALRTDLSELRRQFDRAGADDAAIRNEVQRIERRQRDLEERLEKVAKELREELRADRQKHEEDVKAIEATLAAVQRHVESASARVIAESREATGVLVAAASRFDVATQKVEHDAEEHQRQDERLVTVESTVAAIADELGVEVRHGSDPPPSSDKDAKKKPQTKLARIEGRAKSVSWSVVALAALQVVWQLIQVMGKP